MQYFASREPEEKGPLTWPEGNGWIAARLIERLRKYLRTGGVVYRVARSGSQLRVLTEQTEYIADAVICTDISGNITFLNLIAEKMTGWSLQEVAGQPMAEAFHIMDATTREAIANPMARAVRHNEIGHLPLNCVLVRRDGVEIFIEDSAAPIHDRGGQATGAVIVFRDVSAAR